MSKTGQTSILQEKKINKLLTKVVFVSILFFFLFIVFIINLKVILSGKANAINKIEDLNIENTSILAEIENIDKKSKIAENYIEIWENGFLPKQKELKGIDIEDLQNSIERLAKETRLDDLVINFSPVILAGRNLEKTNVKVYTTLASLRFNSITDINVFMFLDSLKENLGYFITIQDVNLKRIKRVDQELLDKISNGENVAAVEGDIKIRIYGLGKGRK